MKKTLLKKLKEVTSYVLVLLMILLNFSFVLPAKAVGETMTIGSQSASNGDTITVPVTATFSNIRGVQFHVDYDNSLVTSLGASGCSSSYLSCNDDIAFPFPGKITITWYDVNNPLNLNGEVLLNLQFDVISGDNTSTDISFSNMTITNTNDDEIQDSVEFNNGTITLNPDETAPTLTEVTSVPILTNDNTPAYTFNSDEAGTISYGGGCTSATTNAVAGNNPITFDALADGTYGGCTVTVTDSSGNPSDPLAVSEFTVDTEAPILSELDPVPTPTNDNTPDYSFYTSENGAIAYQGSCSSATTNADSEEVYLTFNFLPEGTYNDCSLTVTDAVGNESDLLNVSSFTIDNTTPVITLTGDAVIDIIVGEVYVDEGATANDNVDGNISGQIVVGGDVLDNQTVGIYVRTFNVSDSAGNPAVEVTRTVNVSEAPDETAPTLSEFTPVPTPTNDNTPDYTFNTDEAGTISYGGACSSATIDATAGNNTITFNSLPDATYDNCTVTVTDSSGNPSDALDVTEFTVDTTPPEIDVLGDNPITIEVGAPYNDAGATAQDDNDGNITGQIVTVDPVDPNTVGQYTVTYNVSDEAGNAATEATRTVNVVDTEAPVISLLGNDPITIEVGTTYNDAGATAADNYDGDLTGSIVTVNPVDENTVGQYTVTYNVTDSSGNPAVEVTRTVNVVDTTAPVITLLGSDPVTIEVGSTYNDAGATADDNYDGNLTGSIVTVNPVNKDILGVYTVTYNVTDSNGNPAVEVTRTVNVVDTTAPVITLLGDDPVTLPVGTPYNDAGATALDNYDGNLTGSIATVNPVNINAIGTYTITYNVSDSSSNPATEVTRTVNIVDVSTPIITLLGDNPATIEVGSVYNDAGATAVDDVDGDLTGQIITVNNVDPNTVGSYAVTYNVSDSSGNPAPEVTRTVNIVDTTPPVITLLGNNPANVEVGYEYNDAGATANDNYDGDITGSIVTVSNVDTNTVGTYQVTYNVSDSNANPADEVVRTINVTPDVTPPVITLNGGNMNIYEGTTYTEPGATASDNIDGDISGDIIISGDIVDTNATGTYSITYNVSDNAGNPASEVTRTVTVLPIEEGQEVLIADITVSTSSPEILIGSNAPGASNVTVPSTVIDAQLNVSAIMDGTDATIPGSLNIDSETSVGDVNIQIPTGTVVSGEAGWTGEINLPQVQENLSVAATPDVGNTAEVNSVIEIGFGDTLLTFNQAVRILITGQAGRDVGYSRGGSFTVITSTCSADTQAAGDALPDGGDCKIDVGDDMVVWTKHFTKFVTYTQTAIPTPPPPSGGGGGAVIIHQQQQSEPEVEEVVLVPFEEVEVLGVEMDYRTIQLNKIIDEASIVYQGDINLILSNIGLNRDTTAEIEGNNKYTTSLIEGFDLAQGEVYAITNFIVYGTETTMKLGAGERAGVVNSYKAAFGKLPTTQSEWEDVIKIANGRWPSETNQEVEDRAKTEFKKVYLRDADMDNPNDNAAVTVIAYGLRPGDRNLDNEKTAIKTFKAIYGYNPSSATDWDTVRAIAYSGATR